MDSTELSEVENLDQLANNAILKGELLQLVKLPMVPWGVEFENTRSYPMQNTTNMEHYGYIIAHILPQILEEVPSKHYELRDYIDVSLSEALKNTFEEDAKNNACEVKLSYSDLRITPIEFIIYSGIRKISPAFAKYWKHLKDICYDIGVPDTEIDFYKFSGETQNEGQMKKGEGLISMLFFCEDCGFYKSIDNNLLTRLVFY